MSVSVSVWLCFSTSVRLPSGPSSSSVCVPVLLCLASLHSRLETHWRNPCTHKHTLMDYLEKPDDPHTSICGGYNLKSTESKPPYTECFLFKVCSTDSVFAHIKTINHFLFPSFFILYLFLSLYNVSLFYVISVYLSVCVHVCVFPFFHLSTSLGDLFVLHNSSLSLYYFLLCFAEPKRVEMEENWTKGIKRFILRQCHNLSTSGIVLRRCAQINFALNK